MARGPTEINVWMSALATPLQIQLGVKSDPIEYRYSYEWLFRLMAEEGVSLLQLGSFFELYQLEDDYFTRVRDGARDHGIEIRSVFTAHRELGGFFRRDRAWERVARRNYERLIDVAALVGARHAGSNPGAVLRDRMDDKKTGTSVYLKHMRELMAYAHNAGLARLTIEPMSCLAEPPTLPEELDAMAGGLNTYHRDTPGTAPVGYCADVSHGYADASGTIVHDHVALFRATLPHLVEVHLKNTDALYSSTFGFTEEQRGRGIVDLAVFRDLLHAEAERLPVNELVCYLEIGGPKLGRDYSDCLLEEELRESLRHCRGVFSEERTHA